MAASCCRPTSVTKSAGTSESGGPSNSSSTKALPSVNSNTVTHLAASGEGPEIVVPPVPIAIGSGTPWT
jgi:hypothetical protein